MAQKGGGGSRIIGSLAAFGAAFAARKVITFAWKKLTGKEPPVDPEDPQVGIGEALSWAIVIGVGIETARLFAVRAATRGVRKAAARQEE